MKSLRGRLIFAILAATALLLLATGGVIYVLQRRALLAAFDQALVTKTRAMRSALQIDRETREVMLERTGRRFFERRFHRPQQRRRRDEPFQEQRDEFRRRQENTRGRDGHERLDEPETPDAHGPSRQGSRFGRFFANRDDDEDRENRRERREHDEDDEEDHDRGEDDEGEDRPDRPRDPSRPRREETLDLPDWFRVQTAQGRILLQADSPAPEMLPSLPPPAAEPTVTEAQLVNGTPVRLAAVRFALDFPGPPNRRPPALDLVLLAAEDTLALQRQLRATGWILFLSIATALVLAGGVAWSVSAASLRPVEHMAQDIGALREDQLSQRLQTQNLPSELKPVAGRLNDLLARLDQAFRREKGFTADVAHELRTPLAGLSAAMEVALGQDRPAQDYRRALDESLDVARQMQQLVEKLLMLARLDAGQWSPQSQSVAVRRSALRTWQRFVEEAEAKELSFHESIDSETYIQCDERLLDVILGNLLANAVEYTPPGGRIRIEARPRPGVVLLGLENHVDAALDDRQLRDMFDRFWRADQARSHTGMHCGLGLSLVRRCVEVLQGTIHARMKDAKTLRIEVELPYAPPG
jgi:signal transduction histidine kinase